MGNRENRAGSTDSRPLCGWHGSTFYTTLLGQDKDGTTKDAKSAKEENQRISVVEQDLKWAKSFGRLRNVACKSNFARIAIGRCVRLEIGTRFAFVLGLSVGLGDTGRCVTTMVIP